MTWPVALSWRLLCPLLPMRKLKLQENDEQDFSGSGSQGKGQWSPDSTPGPFWFLQEPCLISRIQLLPLFHCPGCCVWGRLWDWIFAQPTPGSWKQDHVRNIVSCLSLDEGLLTPDQDCPQLSSLLGFQPTCAVLVVTQLINWSLQHPG